MLNLNFQNFDYNQEKDISVEIHEMLEPFHHLNQQPVEKPMRDFYMKALSSWYKVPKDKLQVSRDVIDMFFVWGFLMDDMLDSADLRQGSPTSHAIYGVRSVLNTAKYKMTLFFKNIHNHCDREVFQMVAKSLALAHKGQGRELYCRDNSVCPTEEEYLEIQFEKNYIMGLADNLMQIFSETKIGTSNIGNALSVFVQIRNDYLGLCSDEVAKLKTFCEDISDGKFSFPIVHGVLTRPDDRRIFDILKQKTKDTETKKFCLSLLKEFGSLDYTYQFLVKMKNEMIEELKHLPENEMFMTFLNVALDFD